ncbi:ANKYRIN REPEAT PLANT PROTEIN [Salix purpurea]|uniref:ANKYRIN REPEAT PLANT PROTEIN n=1 Tax=Salix purpurea TaxID=77065 RepID=A0A9Q0ZNE9_SALPP|nr:ANKYRIN REPEAT PLANT PROTEIN [Salix purpurea]
MTRELTGKKDDTPLHSAARAGNLGAVMEILTGTGEEELKELLEKQNQSGETALYVAAEYAVHAAAAAQGHIEIVNFLQPGISTRIDQKGQTALHMAVKGQNIEVVEELVVAEPSSFTKDSGIEKNNQERSAVGYRKTVSKKLR